MPDTALHTVAFLDELEAAVGKTVLTANQVTVWEAMRLAGRVTPQQGLGRLFREGSPAACPPSAPRSLSRQPRITA